jgi:hypothetical protein
MDLELEWPIDYQKRLAMIDEVDFGMGCSLTGIDQGGIWGSLHPVDEYVSSLRSSQTKFNSSYFKLDLSTARRESDIDEKVSSAAIKTIQTAPEKSKDHADKSKKPKVTKRMQTGGGKTGEYILGIGEMALGAGLMVAGAAVELGSLGTLTVAVAFEEAAAFALIADGFARTMRNRDISLDRTIPPATWKSSDVYAPDRPLPRDPYGKPIPESDAPHTELGKEKGRREKYPQAREFDGDGNWIRDIDFTDHGRPHDHEICPHQHDYIPNPTGGTPERDKIGKPVPEWNYP